MVNKWSEKEKVFVGMSGGVDSSVAALLLKEAGFEVTGVFIRGWYPEFLTCNWKEDRRDAMRVAAALDIPFLTINAEESYKREVVDYMISEYSRGRTPNPDVMCNRHVKFGVFYKEAINRGADYIATGHYAKMDSNSEEIELKMGEDRNKDQSYFLWNVDKSALTSTLFPLGNYKKEEIRSIAKKNNLVTANKKDSQGVCFLGKVSMKEFISHYVSPKEGEVLDPYGEVIGYHPGAMLFTYGERKGFTVTKKGTEDKPRYVVAKDIEKNTITVAEKTNDKFSKYNKEKVLIENTNWISREPEESEELLVRYRYRQPLIRAKLQKNDEYHIVIFDEPQESVTSGQSLVVYKDDVCLGGGIIM
ncbi:MAG: tRNA 2-thiouridine(34) synthase MnmA [Candidatus Campbellbacteria bacterium]|nr:tRNA 2-thiouridine(34) synthase MnmA [Candidatus Campbellbacteria bacterium]